MTRSGTSGEDGFFSAPTVPQPQVPGFDEPGPSLPPGSGWYGGNRDARAQAGGRRPRRGRFRFLRRLAAVMVGCAVLGALTLGGLLLVTPPVGDAPARAQAIDRAHHVAYPGPLVPARFAAALTSTEDHRFYSEPGIDPFGVARFLWGQATGQPDQGGATLYQQLAKMLYAGHNSGAAVYADEIGDGIKLYLTYPKPQILRMYADVAYFGHGYYGLAAASCGYFRVTPAHLSWPQAAMLAGLVQAPSADDPLRHFPVARAREDHVLGRLVATGALTRAQADQAYRQPLHLAGGSGTGCSG